VRPSPTAGLAHGKFLLIWFMLAGYRAIFSKFGVLDLAANRDSFRWSSAFVLLFLGISSPPGPGHAALAIP